ncbi:MAG: hypothetical protein AB7W59_31070 [Acidimicrobiia bacterium]
MATDATNLLDRAKSNRKTIAAAAGCLLAGVLLTRACAGDSGAQAAPVAPQVLSGPTTTTSTVPAPSVDPLVNLGQLTPTAAALVGPEFDARRELARRAAETMTNTGRDQCALVIGATVGGSWELSTTAGVAHPVPVFAGCPAAWLNPTTTTTAAPAAGS